MVRVLTDDPACFDPGSRIYAGDRQVVVARSRPHKNTLLVQFEDVLTRNDAEALRGLDLAIEPVARRSLAPGEYWPEDLVGLAVHGGGRLLGEVVDVVAGAAQDRLVVKTSAGELIEIPFVDELVPEVLPEEGMIRISPIEGLI
jgi:16S rRNA processing protein RimM